MTEFAHDTAALEAAARDALQEIAPAGAVGPLQDVIREDEGVVTLHFAALQPGYPGWRWTASLSEVEGIDPTVLEVELLPGEGALLAPEWVPWADRLEEYRAQQAAAGEPDETVELASGADEAESDDELDSDDGSDDDDSDDDSDDLDDEDLDLDDDIDDDSDDDESDDDESDDDDLGDDPDDGIDFEDADEDPSDFADSGDEGDD